MTDKEAIDKIQNLIDHIHCDTISTAYTRPATEALSRLTKLVEENAALKAENANIKEAANDLGRRALKAEAELERLRVEHDLTVKHMAIDYNKLVDENATLKAEVERCHSILLGARCVYCGWLASPDTPTQDIGDETLKQHVLTCEKHPVNEYRKRAEKAEAEVDEARPLLEAAMKFNIADRIVLELQDYITIEAEELSRAALAYRERKGEGKK